MTLLDNCHTPTENCLESGRVAAGPVLCCVCLLRPIYARNRCKSDYQYHRLTGFKTDRPMASIAATTRRLTGRTFDSDPAPEGLDTLTLEQWKAANGYDSSSRSYS